VLAEAIFQHGLKNIAAGADAFALTRGIQKAVAKVIEALKEQSRPVKANKREDIVNVARISANNDQKIGDFWPIALRRSARTEHYCRGG